MPNYLFDQKMFATVRIDAPDLKTARERLDEILADLDNSFIDGSTATLSADDGEPDLIEIDGESPDAIPADKCEGCGGRRYRIANRSDGFMAIERCDTCCDEDVSDLDAAIAANIPGLQFLQSDGGCYILGSDDQRITHKSGENPGGNKACPHHVNPALFVTGSTGLIDTCEVCVEGRA